MIPLQIYGKYHLNQYIYWQYYLNQYIFLFSSSDFLCALAFLLPLHLHCLMKSNSRKFLYNKAMALILSRKST